MDRVSQLAVMTTSRGLTAPPLPEGVEKMADEKQTKIKITKSPFTPSHPLNLNGRRLKVPVGVETNVPDEFLPLLTDSNAEFEIVEPKGSGEDEASAGGESKDGAPSSENEGGSEMSLLDQSIPDATEELEGKSPQELAELLDAERRGKNRAGMIAALEGRINATNPADGG